MLLRSTLSAAFRGRSTRGLSSVVAPRGASMGKERPSDSQSNEGPDDPFLLIADELSLLANRLQSLVVTEVPKLASAAEYFFKMGVEGKRLCPAVLLLMASALNVPVRESIADGVSSGLSNELRSRQRSIAEITEMIHVASLLHDDVLDDADTRRGIGSLNFVMGNKLAVLAGDFLFSRACISLASLKNTEVVSLMATAIENLVTGEKMQMTTTSEQRRRTGVHFFHDSCILGCTAWSTTCRRHTTRLLRWFQTVAKLLQFLQGKLRKFQCLRMSMVAIWV